GIDTMDVIKVDDIGFEPLQTALAARLDEAMPKSPSPQLVKTAEELRLDEARENGVPWKQWGRHGDCRPVSSIDVNNLPPNHLFKASVEREETEAEHNVRLGKEVVVFALAAAFVSAIIIWRS